jgi:hypothetical protein
MSNLIVPIGSDIILIDIPPFVDVCAIEEIPDSGLYCYHFNGRIGTSPYPKES